jgi:hypothetical protein
MLLERVQQMVEARRAQPDPVDEKCERDREAGRAAVRALEAWLADDEAQAAYVRAHGTANLSYGLIDDEVHIPCPVDIPESRLGFWVFQRCRGALDAKGFRVRVDDEGDAHFEQLEVRHTSGLERAFARTFGMPDPVLASEVVREAAREVIEAARLAEGYYEAAAEAPALAATVEEYVSDPERVLRDVGAGEAFNWGVSVPIPGTGGSYGARRLATRLLEGKPVHGAPAEPRSVATLLEALMPGGSAEVTNGCHGLMELWLRPKTEDTDNSDEDTDED